MVENIKELENISDQDKFDAFHGMMVDLIKDEIKTNRGEAISYGQAQKPLNVFLKVFIDWANRPTLEKANKLRKLLHVPLDSILMGEIKDNFPNEYMNQVVHTYDLIRNNLKESLIEKGEKVEDSILRKMISPSDFSLDGIIFKEIAGIYTLYRDSICPFCFMHIRQFHASNDEDGELATHIREAHPGADLYTTYRSLSQALKLPLPTLSGFFCVSLVKCYCYCYCPYQKRYFI